MPLPHDNYDPVYVHSRRESIVLLIAFAVFLAWSVGVSYFLGYNLTEEETTRTVMGIPRWVFWGVAVPWMGANLFTFGFCLFFMADDPLGEELDVAAEQSDVEAESEGRS